jgi:glycosyltransferase involved in cell wall biosynthesis
VLEAMACGAAVVTANNSSLPEVAGDAALLIDAHDTDALSNAMIRLLSDNDLRKAMQAKALEQAKKFSWQKSAEELRAAFS